MGSTLVMVDIKRITVNTRKINRMKMMNTSLGKAPGKFNSRVGTIFLILQEILAIEIIMEKTLITLIKLSLACSRMEA
jgi:hypothetical protein